MASCAQRQSCVWVPTFNCIHTHNHRHQHGLMMKRKTNSIPALFAATTNRVHLDHTTIKGLLLQHPVIAILNHLHTNVNHPQNYL